MLSVVPVQVTAWPIADVWLLKLSDCWLFYANPKYKMEYLFMTAEVKHQEKP